ncbi:hypothetical protein [Nannocystis punicea]|uniref:Uncharacterized protein n=1 Tax=Nannocystis punicea TaxID=2995304 RepID=A0ABY7GT73_9BACT|nr:hypothetical protein [Nannocystis poenicansa]WAS90113.1 hypothetical protein O0S08_28295 [Nannocystis poenicansa]
MGDACVGLFGVPAECLGEQWCMPEPAVQVFLGCRPFTICKPNPRLVCTASDSGPRAFHTVGCTPIGFGPCEPQPSLPDGTPPPC